MNKFLLAALLLVVSAPAALAGQTSAMNEWRTGTERTYGRMSIYSISTERGHFNRGSESVKFDTNFPNAWANFNVDGNITINGGVNTTGPDPYVVLGRSYSNETGSFYNYDRATGYQTVQGHFNVRSHQQTMGF